MKDSHSRYHIKPIIINTKASYAAYMLSGTLRNKKRFLSGKTAAYHDGTFLVANDSMVLTDAWHHFNIATNS